MRYRTPLLATPSIPASLRTRLQPVCIALAATEPIELFRSAEAELTESSFLELRFDALTHPSKGVPALREFFDRHRTATVLATCRRIVGGGGFAGSVEEQLALLLRFASDGAALVDIELETLEATAPERLLQFGSDLARTGAAVVVSAHDFLATRNLEQTLATLRVLGAPARAAIYKVVSTAQTLADNLAMLRFLEVASLECAVVGMCMGAAGLTSRVLGLRAGSLWTFAAASRSKPTAAGQVPARTLREQYRVQTLSAATRIYGVAGNPVEHSLSPAMHNAAFRAAEVDAVYLPLHTTSVQDLLHLTRELPIAGLSVTMPWKVEILPYLDQVDALADAIGAVNTVLCREDGSLWGTNTDADAIVEPLARRIPLRGAPVLLLGAGGAARAAAFALQRAGAKVSILNRTRSAAERLAHDTGAHLADAAELGSFTAIVNATPMGMVGPLEAELPLQPAALRGVTVVFETVYRPVETPLVREARLLGIPVVTGLEMFLHQGVRQWLLWTGRQQAPIPVMEAVLEGKGRAEGANVWQSSTQ